MTDNDKQRFAVAMLTMFKAFGKDSDKDISRLCFVALKHMTIEDAELCISLAIMNSNKFPTVYELKRFVSMIPARELPRIEHTPVINRDMASDSARLVEMALDGTLSHENLIEGMMVMEKKYPGVGWRSEASHLAAHYTRGEERVRQND